jgi:GT2 family glycosyltransferase
MTSQTTKVSIVIVNWRTPLLLKRCLEAISNDDSAKDFEIFVVDNASGDQSLAILSTEFPSVKVIANQDNLGFSKACNQAIPLTSGEYILLLNPDTLVVDSAISQLAAFLDNNSQCGAVGPKVLNDDGTLQLACRRSFPTPIAALFRLTYLSKLFPGHPIFAKYNMTYANPEEIYQVDALSGSCMMVRRKAIAQIGLLDEDIFMFGEDIDWCWRIKQSGWQIVYCPQAVIYHSHGAASRLRPAGATINLHKGMAVFYRKHLAKNYWPVFNQLVYLVIWLRALVFIVINTFKARLSRQSSL